MEIKIMIITVIIAVVLSKKQKKQKIGGDWMSIMEIKDKREKGRQFEFYVAQLLQDLGFEGVKITPPTADGGRDIDAWYKGEQYAIECKCWTYNAYDWRTKVGHDTCRSIIGYCVDKAHKRKVKPVIITTSYFSNKALEYGKRNGIWMVDRTELIKLENRRQKMTYKKRGGLFQFR